MHWDRLFEDLEGQLASEWEAERAALDAESERLRISRLDVRSRLRALCTHSAIATIELADGSRSSATLRALGADWVAAESVETTTSLPARRISVIPLVAITGLAIDHGMLLSSVEQPEPASVEPPLRERMTLGFVLRDLARRRSPVRLDLRGGSGLHGTIDRAGADHLDLALHDPGEVRRRSAVHEFRIIPFAALLRIGVEGDGTQLP